MSTEEQHNVRLHHGHYSTPKKMDSFDSSLNQSRDTSLNQSRDCSLNSSKLDSTGYNSSPATTPVGRDNKAGWYNIHEKHASLASRSHAEIILCGDSIIAGLSRYPKVWRKFFEPLRALNFGVGGDRTQHILWRAENINISTSVKCVVLHCGTNNIDRDTPTCIANGILSIAITFQEKVPELNVIVTALLPRDLDFSFRREKIKKVNSILKNTCKEKFEGVHFMKQDNDWTQEDGRLNEDLYYTDYLHLIEKGNEKFATSISNAVEKILQKESLCYSSEEESDIEVNRYHYKRQQSEKRKRRRSESDEHSSSSKRSKKSTSSHHRSHKSKSSKDRARLEDNQTVSKSKYSWSAARERGEELKKEKTEESELTSVEITSAEITSVENEDNSHLYGTAKSIDISLDERKRLEARRSKFAALEAATNGKTKLKSVVTPSALVAKIKKSQTDARNQLTSHRLKVPAESPYSDKNIKKKFFSDYGSGSNSE